MHTNFKVGLYTIVGLALGLSVMIKAHALVPEPPNPLSTANLSFDQRLDQIQQTDAALLQATPAERKAYWKKLQIQRKAMSLEERKLVHDKMQASWKSMTPEQKEAIKAERKAFFDKLTPDEQATMRAHKAKWEHMNPEEKKNWNTKAS